MDALLYATKEVGLQANTKKKLNVYRCFSTRMQNKIVIQTVTKCSKFKNMGVIVTNQDMRI
jgi:hypothetical protein